MKPSRTHYPSLIGFLAFAITALLLFTLGFVLGLSALFVWFFEDSADTSGMIYAATISFLGMLLGIVAVISLLRYLNKPFANAPVPTSLRGWQIVAGVIGTGLVLLLGSLVRNNSTVNWLALPLLTIPAVILPLWVITGLGVRDLVLGSRWRTGSVLGISLTVTPLILFTLEAVVMVVILVFVILYAAFNPQVAAEFERLSMKFMLIDIQSQAGAEQALMILAPYLTKPAVVVPAAVFLAVIVPLLEELFKPLAVWLLAGRLESAAQGFSLGALCGAGFALWETFNAGGQAADWGILLFTRIGTGLLHVTTSALVGAAIYLAVQERRYLRLLGNYLLAVLLHGLWNASAVTMSFSALMVAYNQLVGYAPFLWVSMAGLVSLAGVMLATLIASNRKFQKTMPIQAPAEEPAFQNDAGA